MSLDQFQELSSGHIFVVDDDLILNELFCNFLNSKGFNTTGVGSLNEAFEVLKTNVPMDLILLDYQLGDGTGLDVVSRLGGENKEVLP
ncbi:MAG TPA: response regulator, partial [Cellvibrio sp.]|nr:response regulator [Cellvibrio sp.]